MGKNLAELAEAIEQGGGFLTVIEVLQVERDLAAIGDEEVKEGFENILAAKRVQQNVHKLPNKLIEDLRSVLKTEEEAKKKDVSAATPKSGSALNQDWGRRALP
jgi:hypothetical protein